MSKYPKIHIYITTLVVFLIIAGSVYFFVQLRSRPHMDAMPVEKTDITQGVNTDGTVQAAQNLGLSFQQGGTVSKINVNAGDKVKKGQVLVELDSNSLSAVLRQAQAAVQSSEAGYDKLLNGATNQDIQVVQVALDNAKTSLDNTIRQQQVLVDNARSTMFNAGLAATPFGGSSSTGIITISGTYSGEQGQYLVSLYSAGDGMHFKISGLESGSGSVNRGTPIPLGNNGLYINFSATGTFNSSDTWTISIPNTQVPIYVANYNAYQAALQNQSAAIAAAQNAVNTAQAALDLKQIKARPEDVATAAAQVNAARAQYQLAQDSYSHSILTAPIDGVITSVNTKVGQIIAGSTLAPGVPAIEMISGQKFQVETFVTETDIGNIKVNDPAQVTLDAYGNSTIFPATVVAIDPAATIIAGVSTYKVTMQFNTEDERIRDGMGANVTIIDEKHSGVLAIPKSSLLKDNGKIFVLVDQGQGNPKKTEITAGVAGIEGKVEVLSGLNEGQKVIYFGN